MINIKELILFTKPLHVLYVEDDLNICENYTKVFSELFASVEVAYNGYDGLEKYENGTFDIVITDINMPKMNGIEMITEIFKKSPEQTIIVTSAHDESSYLLQLIELGIEKFLMKPVDFKKMISVLYKVCKQLDEKRELLEYQNNMESENISISTLAHELKIKNEELEETINALTQKENINITLVDGIEKEKTFSEEELKFYIPEQETLSAKDFVEGFTGDMEGLNDHLEGIEEIMELHIHQNLAESTVESVKELSEDFLAYAHQLTTTYEFSNLQCALEEFSKALLEVKDFEKLKEMKAFLFGISDSLQRFRAEVFVECTAKDIHFLDSSIISDCLQTQGMLSVKDECAQEDLDDMFF